MASFRNLSEAVKAGAFRQDLYYRLNVIQVAVPPLAHDWPGNVRELRNAIEHGMILEETSFIQTSSLPITIRTPPRRT